MNMPHLPRRGINAPASASFRRRENIESITPLSELQAGLLSHALRSIGEDPYLEQHGFLLEGQLDTDLFHQAWQDVVDRHAILRSDMRWEKLERPVLVTYRKTPLSLQRLDWSAMSRDQQRDALGAAWAKCRQEGFDFARAADLSMQLIRVGVDTHWFIWRSHHAQMDGWSLSRILGEALFAYAERSKGRHPALRPAAPFSDYLKWLHRQPEEDARSWWRQHLGQVAEVAPLPRGKPQLRPTSRFAEQEVRLDRALADTLFDSCRAMGVTLNTLCQAAWGLLLARHGYRSGAVMGVTTSGRSAELPGIDEMAGLFINTLPLHIECPASERVAIWLSALQRTNAEMRRFEHTPLRLAQAQSGLGQGAAPLFETVIVFENYPVDQALRDQGGLGVTVRPLSLDASAAPGVIRDSKGRTHYPLSLILVPEEEIVAVLAYDRTRFSDEDGGRLLRQWCQLMQSLAAQPQSRLGEISWEGAPLEPPAQRPVWRGVLERVGEQAARRAEAEALWCEGERLSHGALWSWSNRVAQGLARRGVAREERVGLCLTRGLALPVGLLGILKAGAAFVPLDPEYPPDRLRAMLRDGGIRRVLVDAQTVSQLGDVLSGYETLPIESFAEESDAEIKAEIHPDQLAYVIYTSGSTGTPKGVAISHRSLALHLDDFQQRFAVGAADRVLQFSTVNFDAFLDQLLAPLSVGAAVVMRGPGLWDMAVLNRVLAEQPVSLAYLPCAYWQQWLHDLPAALPSLRVMMVGGEALPGDALRRWFEGPLGHVRLDNRYGPTETTVTALVHETRAVDGQQAVVPIGSSYPHRSAQVLDVDGNPVPEGGVGELCIGGDSLARGYLNRPGLTAERFVPDPWGHAGGRLYRTGDLCRRRADGVVEFLGRIDGQVKLRGYRIELGEIEAALRGCAGVAMAAAALRGEGAGRRIIGYVTGAADAATVLAELRDKLPGPMVPSVVVVLEALPSLPNGKLDRNALPEPEQTTAGIVAPRDATEEKLLRIWQAVLGRDAIGVEENFFAAGGDSILSLQLVARARQAGLRLTPKDVFENPTIAQMARVAQALAAAERQAERHEALPLTPIQARFFAHHPEAPSHWNQSVLLRVKGRLEETALRAAIAALLRRHDALRLRFENTAQGWQQRVVPADSITEIPLSLEALPETGWEPLLQQRGEALQRSLDIGQGPLLRAGYFPIGDGAEGRLLLAIHHLAVDGVSWRILLEELQQGYAQARSGAAVELPPVGTPWSAWVAGLREAAQRPALAEELGWWQAMLAPAAGQALPIPPLPGRRLDQSDVLRWEISPERTRQLLAEAPRAYRLRVDELLLAALAQTLSRWGDRAGVLLDLEAHGREEEEVSGAELSRTVGWFTARHPLWLAAQGSADAALRGAKAALRAVPAKGVRWGQLRHLADPALQAKAAALAHPQVSFNYLGQFDQSLAAEGMFGFAQEAAGSAVSGESRLDHALDINALVAEGRLSVSCRYSPAQLDTPTAQQLMRDFAAEVERLIAHCAEAQMVITPEDVPLAKLDAMALAKLPLPVDEIADLYAATPLQQGLLFHSLLQEGQGYYVNQRCISLVGRLETRALRAAWQHAVDRHDILRTQFVWPEDGEAVQLVRRTATLPWAEQDWSDETETGYAARLAEWRRADLARGFDLSQPPLLRVAVFLRPDGGHDVVLTNHHVLLDGWSSAQLLSEVLRDYAARLRGEVAALPPPVPFRRYVAWLQAQPSAEGWWRARLAALSQPAQGLLETLPAPRDPRPGHGEKRQHLSADLSQRLRQAAQGGAVTLNTLMQGAWALLLARRGGRGPVVFGVTVSGRPAELAEAERMQGLFINSLPIWVEVPSSQPLSSWLGELQRLNGAMRQHEHTPLHRLQQWAGQPGEALFDSLLVFENYPVDAVVRDSAQSFALRQSDLAERTHYPLALAISGDEDIHLAWGWKTERADFAEIERLATQYVSLLEQFAASLDRPLGALILPAPVEPPAQRPVWRGVLERIAEQAARRSEAEALWCEGERLSHGALWSWSNRVAQGLARRGVAREERVGLCLTRGLALPAGLLGILKAGAAFVPLDPDYPPDRLRAMLRDGGIRRVVVDAQTASQLGDVLQGHETLPIESFAEESDAEIEVEIHPDQLAYVIYTSGSTGTPKGVAISHGALALHLDDFIPAFGYTASDAVLQFSTFNFDGGIEQLLPGLCVGGRVVMRGPSMWDLDRLSAVLRDEAVTVADIPTAYWQQWQSRLPEALPALRRVTVGGEALPGDALRRWREGPLGHVRLDNRYGPTETTISVLYRRTEASDEASVMVPIGSSYPHRSAQVLDVDGNPVPEGGVGELCIGGDSLARGYLNRPGLTAERFVPDPWGHAGGRLYRTGDLCRRRADGVVEFLGRIDGQVKLRGYRIELGEIEAALRGCAGVDMAAAALRGEGAGRRIIGYVTGTVDAATVLSELRDKLPGPMVPSAVVVLAALPSLPNGKLDRNALPEPEQTTAAIVAPRDAMEEKLLGIWQAVLGQEGISVTDNFFAIGGDSLSALKLLALAKARGLPALTLPLIFAHPVLAEQAAALRGEAGPPAGAPMPLNAAAGAAPLFCIHPGYGLVLEYRPLAEALADCVPVQGLACPAYAEPGWAPADLAALAADYVVRLRAVQKQGPYRLLGWSLGGWIAVAMAAALRAAGEEVGFLGLVDCRADPRARPAIAADPAARQARRDAWRQRLAEQGGGLSLEAVDQVAARLAALTDTALPALDLAPELWWSSTAPDPAAVSTAWARPGAPAPRLHGAIDAPHEAMMQHPGLLEALRRRLGEAAPGG
ncbi:non-ribosomal peptide synthetase [Pseudoroseomonas cervicalis]|uniref:non-ribosomal peptide synthetase n=1 Tax=Teichococcus cervicalis TaxID=204525 RepID=UPI0027842AD8|nr:non-ribosomal peptide synthetase [Pseudoroseomonas cervicalis]MDQ1081787.1 amino acid adenylation domain-containing protein/non-ribosomal peptide synthase protein (TIGR01720 family) [Pseudoroseomonas cervicalis]